MVEIRKYNHFSDAHNLKRIGRHRGCTGLHGANSSISMGHACTSRDESHDTPAMEETAGRVGRIEVNT